MNFTLFPDIFCTISFFIAIVCLFKFNRTLFDVYFRHLLFVLLLIYFFVGLSNSLEHRHITGYFDKFEDYLEILFIPVFIFFVFSMKTRNEIAERKKALETLDVSNLQWQTTFDAMNDAVFLLQTDGKILQCNETMTKLINKQSNEIIGSTCWELIHGQTKPIENCPFVRMLETHQRENLVLAVGDKWLDVTSDPVFNKDGEIISAVHIISDITERKQIETEREKLVAELQTALAKVKTLSGLLPICSSCKKIRDDKGYWNQIEVYIQDHSDAEFSHGICPECIKKLYPDFSDNE